MNDHVMGIRTWRDLPDRGGTTQERKRERKSVISGPCLIHAVAFIQALDQSARPETVWR